MTARARAFLQHGFTLMESVIAIAVLAVVSAAIISLNGNLRLQSSNFSNLQIATQVLQACVDEVLINREINGYGGTHTCPYTSNPTNNLSTGYTLTLSETAADSTNSPCPSTCKRVTISIAPTNGTAWNSVTLLFMNY